MEFHTKGYPTVNFRTMLQQKNTGRSWEELLFENRNKAYGAYQLRVNYTATLNRSMIYALLGIATFFLIPLFLLHFFLKEVPVVEDHRFERVFIDPIFIPVVPAVPKSISPPPPPPAKPVIDNAFKPVAQPADPPVVPPAVPVDPSLVAGTTVAPGISPGTHPPSCPTADVPTPPANVPLNYAAVDIKPDFPGGLDKFYEFIQKHLRFTAEAREAGLSGRFYVSFIVSEDGSLNGIQMMRAIGFGQDEEIKRVLSMSPFWKPGQFQSKPVKTVMVLPVNFSLVQ